MDLVDEHDRAGRRLKLLDHLLEALLEVAAIARAGEQRAHVERKHRRVAQHLRHFAVHDAAREAFGDRRLADAGVADEQRIVLLAAAQHLDGATDLGLATDQRVDLALARLLVEVHAIGFERVALLLGVVAGLGIGVLVHAAHRLALGEPCPLGDTVADVVDRVVAGHVLLLQEIGGMALALGKDRDQHVRAGDFLTARRLHMDHGALDHALEPGRWLGVLVALGHEIVEFGLDIGGQAALELFQIDIAGAHHGGRILVFEQRKKQMLQRGVFVVALIGERERPVKRLFEATRKSWHYGLVLVVGIDAAGRPRTLHSPI